MRKFYFLSALFWSFTAQAQISFSVESSAYCTQQGCSELLANDFPVVYETTGYTVSSVPYFQVANLPTVYTPSPNSGMIDATGDDTWSPIISLPFSFSFYGNNYNQLLVGTNGVITFDLVGQTPLLGCPWSFNQTIPNANFPIKNAIFGVYQDTDIRTVPSGGSVTNPMVQNVNYFLLDAGQHAAPNRVFVANFNELPQYMCENSVGLQTFQIVLHEGTNIIDVIVKQRTPCTTWNSGSGLIGLLNASGTQAIVPPARNTGTWSATNEAWRFMPSGNAIPATLTWSENGNTIGTDNPVVVCPEQTTVYTATLTYENTPIQVAQDIVVSPIVHDLGVPMDLQVCGDAPYIVNLTDNTSVVLANVNPNWYQVSFHESLSAAELATEPIQTASAYSFTQSQTIYMRIEDINFTGCHFIRPFQIEGILAPLPPTGSATQTFSPGQTLANLIVNGQNIQWYNHPTAGNVLPPTTPLVHNTTYYASQSVSGCESRMLPQRLAVTVSSTLGNTAFTGANVALYPNPAENTLTVAFPETISKTEVFNALGQLVLRSSINAKEATLDISTLSRGQYFIKVYAADQQVVSKFIKK